MARPAVDFVSPDLIKLEKKIGKFTKLGLPIAQQKTMDRGAGATKVNAQRRVKRDMILRNKWTMNSIRVEKSKGLFRTQTPAKVGSVQPYMADQEFGGISRSKGKQGKRITTTYASGEGENARPRRRRAKGKNQIRKIRLQNKSYKGKTKMQKAIIAIKQAAPKGRGKHVYLDMPWTKGKKGIFKVMGGKRRPRIKMVHSLKKRSVVVPKRPWLKPSVAAIVPLMPTFYVLELNAQARFHLL
jgi:hypothetical protein